MPEVILMSVYLTTVAVFDVNLSPANIKLIDRPSFPVAYVKFRADKSPEPVTDSASGVPKTLRTWG
jgi:hypothetical protein